MAGYNNWDESWDKTWANCSGEEGRQGGRERRSPMHCPMLPSKSFASECGHVCDVTSNQYTVVRFLIENNFIPFLSFGIEGLR